MEEYKREQEAYETDRELPASEPVKSVEEMGAGEKVILFDGYDFSEHRDLDPGNTEDRKLPANAGKKEESYASEIVEKNRVQESDQTAENLQRQSKSKHQNQGLLLFLKTAALLEAILLVLGIGLVGGFCLAGRMSPAELFRGASEVVRQARQPAGAGEEIIETTSRYVTDLKGALSAYSKSEFGPFTASVTEQNGLEYLCLAHEDVKLYFQNEYTLEDVDRNKRIRIENAHRVTEFEWEYDLNGDLRELVPKLGSFGETTKEQLVFTRYAESDIIAEELRFVDLETLQDDAPIYLRKELLDYFKVEKQTSAALDSVLKLTAGKVVYRYYMSEDLIKKGLFLEEDYYFTMEEDGITLHCVVGVKNGGYLGELTASVVQSASGFSLTNFRFGAYATGTVMDPESEQIIRPQEKQVDEYITMNSGDYRYYVPVLDSIEKMSYDKTNIVTEQGFKVYREDGIKTSKIGIDVSRYQGNIDWNEVKKAGVEFAIIRMGFRGYGQGSLEVDPCYEQNIKGATKAGIPVGVYFFSQAITVQEAVEEAEFVLKWVKDYELTYPIIFDTEEIAGVNARANELPLELRTDIAIAFLERIKAAGYTPMLYANTRWLVLNVNLERLKEYDLWYAYFGDALSFPYHFDMWQYSDKGTVPGIDEPVDLNICFKEYSKTP